MEQFPLTIYCLTDWFAPLHLAQKSTHLTFSPVAFLPRTHLPLPPTESLLWPPSAKLHTLPHTPSVPLCPQPLCIILEGYHNPGLYWSNIVRYAIWGCCIFLNKLEMQSWNIKGHANMKKNFFSKTRNKLFVVLKWHFSHHYSSAHNFQPKEMSVVSFAHTFQLPPSFWPFSPF